MYVGEEKEIEKPTPQEGNNWRELAERFILSTGMI
jgi:hypothetical protein